MCEVLDRIEKRGYAIGFALGFTLGKAEWFAYGADEQARKTVINLYEMGLKPADIARAVDRSPSLVQKWLEAGMA